MTEPKLTVGRVETWRPIDAERVLDKAGLNDDDTHSERASRIAAGHVRVAIRMLVQELNGRLGPPAPQPEAKARPDYTCPICGKDCWSDCKHDWAQTLAAANARIAELTRERRNEMDKEARVGYERGQAVGYSNGLAAAKEACAKRLEARAEEFDRLGLWKDREVAQMLRDAARLVRETEVPGP